MKYVFVFAFFLFGDRCFGAYYPWPILYVRESDINKILDEMVLHPMNDKEKARLRRLVGWTQFKPSHLWPEIIMISNY